MERFGITNSVDQMLSQPMLQESCMDKVAVCIIAFLPNMVDSSASQRNSYIKELTEVSGYF
jgi:hypothetical protein